AGRPTLLRALRALPERLEWHATIYWPRPTTPPATLSRRLRDRITFVEATEATEAEVLATADIAIFASDGIRPAPGAVIRALGAGALPVVSRLPAYEEVLGDGERGLMFEPGETQTLSAHLERLIADPDLPAEGARRTESM